MKKEYLDFLYEQRAVVQTEINRLVEVCKAPRNGECQGCGFEPDAALETRRKQILGINKSIEEYLKLHN